jgi:hypothetical protein
MGDHGMEPIKKQINLAALLPQIPSDRIIVSGALAMIYPSQTIDSQSVSEQLEQSLQQLQLNGASVGGEFHLKSRQRPEDPWHYGEAIWASSSGEGYWYLYNPLNPDVFVDPPITGMHGHSARMPSMATGFFLKAPGLRPRTVAEVNMIDAAPTFTSLLGMDAPRDCQGQSILH